MNKTEILRYQQPRTYDRIGPTLFRVWTATCTIPMILGNIKLLVSEVGSGLPQGSVSGAVSCMYVCIFIWIKHTGCNTRDHTH